MEVTNELKELISEYRCSCRLQSHVDAYMKIENLLIETLERPEIKSFEQTGEWQLNPPFGKHWRDEYTIEKIDGNKLRVAFTGFGTIMIFKNQSKRYRYCYYDDFEQKISRFLS